MVRAAPLLLVLAGCSQLFGLDKPVPVDAAVDLDGAEIDAFVGTGCITLPLRAVDDDDGDAVTDDQDNCIGLASMPADTDGDGIGNACDPNPDERDVRRHLCTGGCQYVRDSRLRGAKCRHR